MILKIFFECRSSRALQVDARCAREKIDSEWRVVKSLEANLLCRLWPSGCSFARESFFPLDVRGVFLVTRSTTLTHVVHCACLPSFAIGAHVSTSANSMQNFQASSHEILISSNHAHSPVCGRDYWKDCSKWVGTRSLDPDPTLYKLLDNVVDISRNIRMCKGLHSTW